MESAKIEFIDRLLNTIPVAIRMSFFFRKGNKGLGLKPGWVHGETLRGGSAGSFVRYCKISHTSCNLRYKRLVSIGDRWW